MLVKLTCTMSLPLNQPEGNHLETLVFTAGLTLMRQALVLVSTRLEQEADRTCPRPPVVPPQSSGMDRSLASRVRALARSNSPDGRTAASPAAKPSVPSTPSWLRRDRAEPPGGWWAPQRGSATLGSPWCSWRISPSPPGPLLKPPACLRSLPRPG